MTIILKCIRYINYKYCKMKTFEVITTYKIEGKIVQINTSIIKDLFYSVTMDRSMALNYIGLICGCNL